MTDIDVLVDPFREPGHNQATTAPSVNTAEYRLPEIITAAFVKQAFSSRVQYKQLTALPAILYFVENPPKKLVF